MDNSNNQIVRNSLHPALHYLLQIICGLAAIYFLHLWQHFELPAKGEYFYSGIFRNNYTWTAVGVFSVLGFLCGYFLKTNPLLTGLSLLLFFPATALIEGVVYRGSHNLLPFELAMHMVYMAPVIVSAFAGRLLDKYRKKAKAENNNLKQ
jgi:hypothetical protein